MNISYTLELMEKILWILFSVWILWNFFNYLEKYFHLGGSLPDVPDFVHKFVGVGIGVGLICDILRNYREINLFDMLLADLVLFPLIILMFLVPYIAVKIQNKVYPRCKHGYPGAKKNPQLCFLCQEEKQELERKRIQEEKQELERKSIQEELIQRQQAENLWLAQETIKQQKAEIKKLQEALQKQQRDRLRRQLQWWKTLDGVEFENELAILLRQRGYDVTMTPYTGDGGVDLVLLSDTKHIVVQCKAHNDNIGSRVIRELYGTMMHEKADEGWLVTTSGFSLDARKWAQDKPIKLITIEELLDKTCKEGITVDTNLE